MSQILLKYQGINHLPVSGKMDLATINYIQKELGCNNFAMANYLGQIHVESNGFKAKRESLDYSVQGLIDTFDFFRRNPLLAKSYGRTEHKMANQKMIANIVYADKNRSKGYKLGNLQDGDGWKYRGGFAIQITGKTNYLNLSKAIGDELILTNPDDVIEKYYFLSGKWYFSINDLWSIASKGVNLDISTLLTKKINGGKSHLTERYQWTVFYKNLLNA
jgi:putative chitinase